MYYLHLLMGQMQAVCGPDMTPKARVSDRDTIRPQQAADFWNSAMAFDVVISSSSVQFSPLQIWLYHQQPLQTRTHNGKVKTNQFQHTLIINTFLHFLALSMMEKLPSVPRQKLQRAFPWPPAFLQVSRMHTLRRV